MQTISAKNSAKFAIKKTEHDWAKGDFFHQGLVQAVNLSQPGLQGHGVMTCGCRSKGISLRSSQTSPFIPRGSMDGIFTYIYHKNQPNVGKYTIHGSFRIGEWLLSRLLALSPSENTLDTKTNVKKKTHWFCHQHPKTRIGSQVTMISRHTIAASPLSSYKIETTSSVSEAISPSREELNFSHPSLDLITFPTNNPFNSKIPLCLIVTLSLPWWQVLIYTQTYMGSYGICSS